MHAVYLCNFPYKSATFIIIIIKYKYNLNIFDIMHNVSKPPDPCEMNRNTNHYLNYSKLKY